MPISSKASTTTLKYDYPKIMKSGGMLVLFYKPQCGVVVFNNDLKPTISDPLAQCDIGHQSNDWRMDDFMPWTGSVTLEQ